MPETTTPTTTNPSAPGTQTSEFKLTVVLAIIGSVVSGLGVTFSQLSEQFPDSKFVATVMVIIGMLTTILTALGYMKSRTVVKTALIQSNAAKDQVVDGTVVSRP